MFFRLAFEAGFEVAGTGVDDEDGEVGLAGAGDHVGDEVAVAGSVEDGEGGVGGGELVVCSVDCDAAFTFFGALVHDPGKGEGGFTDVFSFFPVFLYGPLIHYFEIMEEPAHQCALPRINVTDDHKICRRL